MRKLWAAAIRLMLMGAMALLVIDAILLGMRFEVYGIIALLGITFKLTRKRWHTSGAYGTARQAGLPDLLAGNLTAERGLILGRVGQAIRPSKGEALRSLLSPRLPAEWAVKLFAAAFFGPRRADDFIRINDYVHLATFAPAGGGKSVSVLVPNLLSYAGNCVVVDPKGELFKLTAKHRQEAFGNKIVRLDPAGLYGPGDSFNPLDWINPDNADFIDVCRDLANMLVVRTGKEMDPHWTDSAENVICAFIAYICAMEGNPSARNLRAVRAQIASRENYTNALELMQQHEGAYGVLAELGHSLSWHQDRELGSVMTHAQRFTHIFGAPLVGLSTCTSSFDPMELRTGRMTVYLITPSDKMVVWAGLLRMWLGSLLRIITRGKPTEKNPVLFLVDECAHIGHMQALEDAVTLMRGMGIRLWLFFQSLEQVKKCFGDNAGTVLDNLATQQYFSINSYETAEAMSKRIGDAGVVIRTEGSNDGVSVGGDSKNAPTRTSGWNSTVSEVARRLYKPEEILTLPQHAAMIFHKNHYVIVCDKIKYYADRAFRRRGILRKRWGTGRTRGLGLAGMVMGVAALVSALAVTWLVTRIPPRRPAAAVARGGYAGTPLPYQRVPYSGIRR